MEQLQPKPVPLPRSRSPAGQSPIYENHQLKKPTPLPRSNGITLAAASTPAAEEEKVLNEASSFEDVFTKSYNTLTKSLKNKFKSASENVQGKGKLVLETTKTVGLRTERSVRGMIQKRQSTLPHLNSETDKNTSTQKLDRCQSLPSDDIFSSITFNSPIPQSDELTYADDDKDSLPPPEYPPPPLPDESLYDELSVRSSHSGSQGDYYTCPSIMSSLPDFEASRIDDNISDLNKLSIFVGSSSSSSLSDEIMFGMNSLNRSSNTNNVKPNSGCELSSGGKGTYPIAQVSRSESWGFYDTVFLPKVTKPEEYVNIAMQKENASKHKDIQCKDEQNKQYVNVTVANNKQPSAIQNDQYVNVTINDKESLNQSQVLISSPKSAVLKPLQPFKAGEVSEVSATQQSQTKRQESFASTTDSECSSMSVPNELYLNWQPPLLKKNQDRAVNENLSITNRFKNNLFISKTFFSEFDPLCDSANTGNDKGARDRHSVTESLPIFNNEETSSDNNDDFDTVSLPVPPKRFDSITTESKAKPDIPNDVEYFLYQRPITLIENKAVQSKTQEMQEDCSTAQTLQSVSPEKDLPPGKRKSQLVRWTSMKRAMKKLADGSPWSPAVMRKSRTKDEDESGSSTEAIERPIISSNSAPLHSGAIYKSTSGGEKQKDFAKRNCHLAEGKLIFTSENSSNKDVIALLHIYSIQIIRETKQSSDGEDLYCFEISNSQRDKPRHVLGCSCTSDRRIWMQRILESMTQVFPSKLSADYTRAGWCFIKEGISGSWVAAWILLHKRTLVFHPSQGKITEIDLRKARLIVLQESEEGCVRVAEHGPLLRIDGPACACYLQMNETRETKAWHRAVREAAVNNGPELQDQQLTNHDLPIIIEKCINFVYTHGSMSEGIYRRSGSNTSVLKLHTEFQKDAWAVQITRNEFSEHDVASVLKRFFRELPEPLLTRELHLVLCNAAALACSEKEKVALYRSQLEKLPPVNYVTTRRLMGHLHHVSQQCERNLMPVDNLAAIWGPTLMHVDVALQQTGMDPNWSRSESQVVGDLISLYPQLFDVDGAELAREQRIQEVLERYHNSAQQTPHTTKPSGDIKVWVHIGSKDSDPVGVTVSAQKCALDVCVELAPHMKVYGHELCLLESVLGGALIRPLHHTERVLDAVLRWSYWDDKDCRDNCLILVLNTILQDIAPLAKPPVAQCGELRFADLKSKNFKVYLFEFSQAKLCYYKDKTGSVKLGEWKIEDIVWYIGHEPKRNPHTRWSLTFINKNGRNKRSKENPYFGFTIAGTTRDEQLRWMAAMLVGEYPQVDLLPKSLLNLME